ncbi:MAG TPA: 4-hydroxyphenylacetate 3-hydroxylase N-terminal domain-containing protein, partial [Thermodesulfobacteriota bacterium]|nr:4-hydroxyphenylacetate 3-hydroxylase N-terminal domain-containing protein [Thermodesulfobacteriota bacterium]
MLKTPEEYVQSLRELDPVVYMKGKRVESVPDEPLLEPGVNAVAVTYEFALLPEYTDTMTAVSHVTGRKVNRLLHINTSQNDLLKKLEMVRLLCRETGCAQRYLCHDALNALYETTHNLDLHFGTDYHV